ncbi:MAG: hypothetical protein J7527_04480 [Chitinophagaceae bacterium]|nr:hypothetical protein [Chitinophagaceae bacterium]
MSFIQQFRVSGRYTAVAMMIFASVSFYGCKAGNAACAMPDSIASAANTPDCLSKSPKPSDPPVSENETEYGFTGGPMNESASLPMHMTE